MQELMAFKWFPFSTFVLLLWRHDVEWECDVIDDVNNGWGECITPIGSESYAWNVRFDSRLIFFIISIPWYKRDEELLPVHCGDQMHNP